MTVHRINDKYISKNKKGEKRTFSQVVKDFSSNFIDGIRNDIRDVIDFVSGNTEIFSGLSFKTKIAFSAAVIALCSIVFNGCTKPDTLPKEPEFTITYPDGPTKTALRSWLPITVNIKNEDGFPFTLTLEKLGTDSLGNETRTLLMNIISSTQELSQAGSVSVLIPSDSILNILETFNAPDVDVDTENVTKIPMFNMSTVGTFMFDADGDSLLFESGIKLVRESEGGETYLRAYQPTDFGYGQIFSERVDNFNDGEPRVFTLESDDGIVEKIYVITAEWDPITGLNLSIREVVEVI